MSGAVDILRDARHVVVRDYPHPDVPDSLTRAGLAVTIYDGPDEADVVVSELVGGEVVTRPTGRRPEAADLLYVHRPFSEVDAVLADAERMGVRTVWRQSVGDGDDPESAGWRSRVEAAGMAYLDRPDISEAARELGRAS